jgi:hypothetical protein
MKEDHGSYEGQKKKKHQMEAKEERSKKVV